MCTFVLVNLWSKRETNYSLLLRQVITNVNDYGDPDWCVVVYYDLITCKAVEHNDYLDQGALFAFLYSSW